MRIVPINLQNQNQKLNIDPHPTFKASLPEAINAINSPSKTNYEKLLKLFGRKIINEIEIILDKKEVPAKIDLKLGQENPELHNIYGLKILDAYLNIPFESLLLTEEKQLSGHCENEIVPKSFGKILKTILVKENAPNPDKITLSV